jgi:hypothetical protein
MYNWAFSAIVSLAIIFLYFRMATKHSWILI